MKIQTSWKDAVIPALTETYSPVAHSELIYLLEKQLGADGYEVKNNFVQQSYNGEQIFGTMSLRKETGIAGDDLAQTMAYQNSYNKRLPIRLVSGGRVFICSNGMIVGDIITFRKHTGDVFPALKEMIKIAIVRMEEDFEKTQRDVLVMKETELTTTLAAELIGRMFVEERILNSNEVNEVARQLRKPKFEEFKANTLWSLYNHATYALNDAAPDRRMQSLKQLHEFSMDVANELVNV
jgi:hypothetical protein